MRIFVPKSKLNRLKIEILYYKGCEGVSPRRSSGTLSIPTNPRVLFVLATLRADILRI